MGAKTIIILLLSTLLLATNIFWVYIALDQATAQKYRQQESREDKARIAVLEQSCR
ncbi:hypothetical protein [Microbulbifer sp. ALW1]|uniref:hypothetical protein n=1 Tax=Microbulbifer sp. (strain ALW1) TaxID=1516059 RepID=UPI00135B84C7|nr:hypothetical protein [Microbulbifer sp. ALW1]